MHQAGSISQLFAGPVLEAMAPLRRFVQQAAQAVRTAQQGRIHPGEGQPVIVMPAFGGGPETTAAFRSILTEAGFAAHDWGLGTDRGTGPFGLNACLRLLEEKVIDVFESDHAAVTIIGWGLSGIYAREVAKRVTPLVRQVITLGTPLVTEGLTARTCTLLDGLDGEYAQLDPGVRKRLGQKPPVPCTSIYTKHDELVPWKLSLLAESRHSENILVPAEGHRQLALHSRTLEVVTHRLAHADDRWRPFSA
jgi:hypothetical protein